MLVEQRYRVTVHNQEKEAIRCTDVVACNRLSAAQIAVIIAFHEYGWHRVRCHVVDDVEEVAT